MKEAGWNADNRHPAIIDPNCGTIGESISILIRSDATDT
jgi:hypothetical protein